MLVGYTKTWQVSIQRHMELGSRLKSSAPGLILTFLCMLTNKLFRGETEEGRQVGCEVVNLPLKWQEGNLSVVKTGVQTARRPRWRILPIQLHQPVRNMEPLLNDFMFYVEDNKTGVHQARAQMYFSNINSWSVLPSGWSLLLLATEKEKLSKVCFKFENNSRGGKWYRNAAYYLFQLYFHSTETAEMRTAAGARQKKAEEADGSCQSFNLLAGLQKAKMFTGFCTYGSLVRGEKQACLWLQQSEGLLLKWASICDGEFWQQPPRLSHPPAVCDYPAWQLNREVIWDSTFLLPGIKICTSECENVKLLNYLYHCKPTRSIV